MKKKMPVITCCPICNHDLHITQLKCDHCETEIKGEFTFSKFNYLDSETLYFIELFIKNRGNIKAVEKEMNVSYPTVKKYLEEAIISLGYTVEEDDEKVEEISKKIHLSILDQIKEGQLKVDEAIEKIKKLKGE